MDLIYCIWICFQIVIGYNLVLPFFLFIAWALIRKRNSVPLTKFSPDYAIIITAYEDIRPVFKAVESILRQNYSNYLVYVVADKCDVSGLNFNDERIILLSPPETLSSNTKSHSYAVSNFKRFHEYVAIIDSDNLVHEDFIPQLNNYFEKGFQAVQGLRKAKNLDTMYACLDAARDIYYHFYDGEILFQLGSSATLSGSGMAFRTSLYKDFLKVNAVTGAGFDKVLQYFIINSGLRIAFNKFAIVYDEKTSKPAQLVNQRSRWINTWFKYFGFGFLLVAKGVRTLNFNQFIYGIILLRPPIFLFILLSGLCFFISIFTSPIISLVWLVAFILFAIGFYISLHINHADAKIYRSLTGIPRFISLQLLSLAKSKNANRDSVATKHYHN